ncbi:hypothetical protein CWC05_09585 [Pseudoalteromonas ruthenica]|uniref:DUF350 domain-containing protein n=2 Tax=Pseudoalteromonas ruthenica TaxID=151081 RepID=A0A5S3Z529_9GAMM|nr:hypothetical protein CWC05_09585 [Pseudoalteromonas ruthenica]
MIMESILGFVPFIMYFGLGYLLILAFLFIYTLITPHCEWTLMKENNAAAATAFSGAFIGFTLPVASAAVNSVSLLDFAIWGVIAGIMQLVTFFLVRLYMPKLSEKIAKGHMSAGAFLGVASLATGILNAACITY